MEFPNAGVVTLWRLDEHHNGGKANVMVLEFRNVMASLLWVCFEHEKRGRVSVRDIKKKKQYDSDIGPVKLRWYQECRGYYFR